MTPSGITVDVIGRIGEDLVHTGVVQCGQQSRR